MMNAVSSLFRDLCNRYGVQPDRRNEAHIPCPQCGKPPKQGAVHFSFNEATGHCFVCGFSCSINKLAGQDCPATYAPPPPPKPKPVGSWLANAEAIVRRACQAPDRIEQWRGYRSGLSLESISHRELGVDVLPAVACKHRRLIFPVRVNGKIVALVGRRLDCDCPAKTQCAYGGQTVLFNGNALKPGAEVVVTENRVDAMLAGQHWPEIVAVGAGSTSYWRLFVDQIAASRPAVVRVWFDNDPSGCPNTETYAAHVQAAIAAGKTPVQPSGIQMVNALRAKGVIAEPFPWPSGSKLKADPGEFITEALRDRRQIA